MHDARTVQIGTILGNIADELDISQELYDEMVEKYEHLGEWIKDDNEERFRTDSEIYTQGSVRLGTMIKPVKEDCEYDVDLVYRRELAKSGVTQEELVQSAGDQLERYIAYRKDEGLDEPELVRRRRCWALNYDGRLALYYDGRFHMDVIPAIPDDEPIKYGIELADTAILITDREQHEWQHSNPKGYAEWFRSREREVFDRQIVSMAAAKKVDIESIPAERVRTPLRRIVQILKRHRDIRYSGDPDDKPISIIITTLAASVYSNETELFSALMSVVRKMPDAVQKTGGKWWIPNPVNPEENFGDRWNEYPQRAERFFEWLGLVEADLSAAEQKTGIANFSESLSPVFGGEVVRKSIERFGRSMDSAQQSGNLKMATGTGTLGSVGASIPKNTWFGD